MPYRGVAEGNRRMSLNLREHWRTLAMAAILVLSGVARCSVPQLHHRADAPEPPAEAISIVEAAR